MSVNIFLQNHSIEVKEERFMRGKIFVSEEAGNVFIWVPGMRQVGNAAQKKTRTINGMKTKANHFNIMEPFF